MKGTPISAKSLRLARSKSSELAVKLTREQKLEQMWAHGSERRQNPFANGQMKLAGSSLRRISRKESVPAI